MRGERWEGEKRKDTELDPRTRTETVLPGLAIPVIFTIFSSPVLTSY